MIYCIYKLTSPSGKIYIGQTKDFKKRMSQYRQGAAKGQRYLRAAIKKYTWDNFSYEILKELRTHSSEKLDKWEIYYIQKYKSTDPEIGYNISTGGEGRKGPYSKEGREIHRKVNQQTTKTEKWRKAYEEGIRKRSESEEWSSKLRERSKAQRKPVYQYDMKGNFLKEWESRVAVQKEYPGDFALVLNRKLGIAHHGFLWLSKEDAEKGLNIYEIRQERIRKAKEISPERREKQRQFAKSEKFKEAMQKVRNSEGYRERVLEGIKKRGQSEKWKKYLEERSTNPSYLAGREKTKRKSKKPVFQYSEYGIFIKEWEGISDAGKELKINIDSITRCCRGVYTHAGGFLWKFKNEEDALKGCSKDSKFYEEKISEEKVASSN